MSDIETLVRAARSGDERAFGEIVRRFQDMAVGYAYSVLGDFPLAEDAAQEAFVRAYRDLAMLRAPAKFPAWFRRIVFKQCDRLIRRKRLPVAPGGEAAAVASAKGDPVGEAERREMRAAVLAAVKGLGEKEREATTLFYINGYSIAEIADFLGAPPGTVKSRLHAARKRLKERLMAMVEDTLKENAPKDSFTKRVAKAIEVYTARGPAHDSIGSPWHKRILAQTNELLASGEEGFRVAVALSQSRRVKARSEAATYFALARDPRGREHLERLMGDESPGVRCRALRAYATLIHPESDDLDPIWETGRPAKEVPAGVDRIAGMLEDDDLKVRWYAAGALGAYAGLADAVVDAALEKALSDPAHKVRHAAARALKRPCPGCGNRPG